MNRIILIISVSCYSILSFSQSESYTNVLLDDINFSNPQEKNTLENKPNINIKDAFKGSLYFTSNAKKEKIDKKPKFNVELDGIIEGEGILEMMPDGYGFLRSAD